MSIALFWYLLVDKWLFMFAGCCGVEPNSRLQAALCGCWWCLLPCSGICWLINGRCSCLLGCSVWSRNSRLQAALRYCWWCLRVPVLVTRQAGWRGRLDTATKKERQTKNGCNVLLLEGLEKIVLDRIKISRGPRARMLWFETNMSRRERRTQCF